MSWTIKDDGDRLVLHVDAWELAGLVKESKEFQLYFPLDDEDQTEAELRLLRHLVKSE